MFEPSAKINTTDDELIMTFAMTVRFHGAVCEGYDLVGHELEVMPKVALADRSRFVAEFIAP